MKKILSILSLFLLNISCSNAQMTTFTRTALFDNLISSDGSEINLNRILLSHKGKTVVIEVWASWCSDCVKNMPNITKLQETHTNADFVFLSCDKSMDAWAKGIEKHELKGDHYLIPDGMKGTFAKAIDLNWIPRYIIVDKTGKIALYNAIETDFEKINTLLKKLD